jgi:hypothetical protein
MTANMRIIIAAVGIAILASPVMAQQSERHSQASAASVAHPHGYATRAHARQTVQREPVEVDRFRTDDCRSVFAQCGYAH